MKRVRDIREQLLGLMDRTEIELTSNLGDHDAIKKAIAAGFFYNTARLRKDGAYRTIKNPQTIHLHPSSGLTKMEVWPCCFLQHPPCMILFKVAALCHASHIVDVYTVICRSGAMREHC